VAFDAGIDFPGDNAAIEELILAAVRTETDDARCPSARHSLHFHQLIKRGRVDVDGVFRE
jgi:hypothetical protein